MHEFDLGDGFGDGLRVGDITGDDHTTIMALQGYFFEGLCSSSQQHNRRTSVGEAHRTGRTDSASGTTNYHDLIHIACSIGARRARFCRKKNVQTNQLPYV